MQFSSSSLHSSAAQNSDVMVGVLNFTLDHACLSCFSHAQFFATLWIIAYQAPLSMGFSRQEYWSELPCPPPRDLPDPGVELASLMSPALAGGFFTTSATWEAPGGRLHPGVWGAVSEKSLAP